MDTGREAWGARKSCLGAWGSSSQALGKSPPSLPGAGGAFVGRVGVQEAEAEGLGLNEARGCWGDTG